MKTECGDQLVPAISIRFAVKIAQWRWVADRVGEYPHALNKRTRSGLHFAGGRRGRSGGPRLTEYQPIDERQPSASASVGRCRADCPQIMRELDQMGCTEMDRRDGLGSVSYP